MFQPLTFTRLLAVDPSLTCSGWGVFALNASGYHLQAVGTVRSLPPKIAMAHRLRDFQEKVQALYKAMQLGSNDIVVCEAPTTMRDPRAAIKVEQVRCIFEDVARELKAFVPGRLNPRTVHNELLGIKGKQASREIVKSSAQVVAQTLFSPRLRELGLLIESGKEAKYQDIFDALLIGHVAIGKVRAALHSGESLPGLFQS